LQFVFFFAIFAVQAQAAAPLVDAVKAGDKSAALALIEKRVDVNAPEPDGTTALHWAAHNGDVDLVQRLIRAGANVKAANAFGATPMSEAAVLADPALLGALLEAGASVESPNADGQTALMVVARTSRVDAAQLLLKSGANVNAVEKWRGQTALMWAAAGKPAGHGACADRGRGQRQRPLCRQRLGTAGDGRAAARSIVPPAD
jgi:ankyrin repeat protein